MDTLSKLLSLHPVRTALTIRCQLGAPWRIEHAAMPAGVVPYHLIVRGGAWLDMDDGTGQRVELQAGDIVLFPHGGAHRIATHDADAATALPQIVDGQHLLTLKRTDGAGPASTILCGEFTFEGGAGDRLLASLPPLVHIRTAARDDFAGLRSLIAMLQVEAETDRPGAELVLSQLASALFALIMRAWLEQAAATPGLFALLSERRLHGAVLGMMASPHEDWTLPRMADACHMSRATFARLFSRTAGMTPATLLLHTRMASAAALLARGRQAVADVGMAVGYQSEAAFNRAFKKATGMGPGQYRRARRLEAPPA